MVTNKNSNQRELTSEEITAFMNNSIMRGEQSEERMLDEAIAETRAEKSREAARNQMKKGR